MKVKTPSDNLILREFTASKQLKLFTSLQQAQISGQLTFTNPQQGTQWHFYLYLGGIVYATGGVHPIRRWQRNLITNLPQIPFDLTGLQEELTVRDVELNSVWEYEQLISWLQENIITPEQVKNAIRFSLKEIMFDVTQSREVICRINQNNILSPKLEPVEPEELIITNQQLWQDWQQANIANRSANLAPIILQPKQLQEKTSASAYQSLCKLLNGNRTLRDLAVQLKTSCLQVTCSLLPYIQSGIFGLVEVADLIEFLPSNNLDLSYYSDRPLIACVDDSYMISHMMEQIVSLAGYRYLGISHPLEAVQTLLNTKPDLIFLDVIMPQINGYDLCAQLREHREFEGIPIIFLTSSSGLIDRLRAKIVGSSDFVKKTIDADELLHKIVQYLPSSGMRNEE
jgi:two-component system, chemotaxis family, response regulator PixG